MICEYCNSTHVGNYGSKRFCSEKCAKGFSTKRKRKEINEKVAKKLKKPKICKPCGRLKQTCDSPFCLKYRMLPTLIKFFGFDVSSIGSTKYLEEFERIIKELNSCYHDEQMNLSELAQKFGHYDGGNFGKIMKSLGIEFRNLSKSMHIAFENDDKFNIKPKEKDFRKGWHITWENKKVYLRSSYEFEFAKELDQIREKYEVESLRVKYFDSQKNRMRIAIPDFYLPEKNMIIEIKSSWTYNKKNMQDRIKYYKAEGFHFKLILDKKIFNHEQIN